MRLAFLIFSATALLPGILRAEAPAPPPPKAYALIVAGEGGEANFTENYKDWCARLYKALTGECGIPAAQVTLLMEKKDALPQNVSAVSTKENVLKAFKQTSETVKPGDQFLLFYIGHGTSQNTTAKLCLPGADIDHLETAAFLNKLRAREVAFINGACGSDGFLDGCSLPGRVMIAATNNSSEGNETYFMEFLVKALEGKAADADKDGAVTILEAFNHAATECPKWYLRQYMSEAGDGWRIEGKQSRELWQKFYGKVKDKVMAPPLNANAEDAEPQLGEWGPQWVGRRMTTEHAMLDDNGDYTGSAIFVNNEFTPLKGEKKEEDGAFAKILKLGKPRGDTGAPSAPLEKKHEGP